MNSGLVLASTFGGAAVLLIAVAFCCSLARLVREHRERAARDRQSDLLLSNVHRLNVHAGQSTFSGVRDHV